MTYSAVATYVAVCLRFRLRRILLRPSPVPTFGIAGFTSYKLSYHNCVAGPGIAPGLEDYEPSVRLYTTPHVNFTHQLYHENDKISFNLAA